MLRKTSENPTVLINSEYVKAIETYEDVDYNTRCNNCGGKVEGGYCACYLKERE